MAGTKKQFEAPPPVVVATTPVAPEEGGAVITVPENPTECRRIDLMRWLGRGIDEWVWACAQQLRVLLHGEVVTTATVVSYASNGLARFFKFLITTQATYPPRALDRRHLEQFVAWLKAHPTRLALTCLGILITCTALGAGLDPIRVGRYSAIVAGPLPEQADPFALFVHTEFPFSVQTVGRAIEQVLVPSGYRLANIPASCPSLPALLAWPLPAVHRRLGPMRLDEALKTLAGPAHYLAVDPVHRLVSFELREEYQTLIGAGTPGRPVPSTADLIESYSAEPTAPEPLPAPALEPAAPAGGFGSITATGGSHCTKRIGPIEKGAELWPIAADLSETFNASTEQVMVGLFEANPESFCYQNLNCLKVGAYLDPPTANGVATTTSSEARRTLQRHFIAWRQRGRSDAVAGATRKEVMTP